jgi:hypothetical protein
MNVLGMSYGHECPDCDPDGKHLVCIDFPGHNAMPFEKPEFGPTREVLRMAAKLAKRAAVLRRPFQDGDVVVVLPERYATRERPRLGQIVRLCDPGYLPFFRSYEVRLSDDHVESLCEDRLRGIFKAACDLAPGEVLLLTLNNSTVSVRCPKQDRLLLYVEGSLRSAREPCGS